MAPQALGQVLDYHQRTRHAFGRYAASLGYIDWETQPSPFRRFVGAPRLALPRPDLTDLPLWDQLQQPGALSPRRLTAAWLGQLLYDSLALSAWKQFKNSRWSLRVNPSSGNLHPTEAYLLIPSIEGLCVEGGLYHYCPEDHSLELRSPIPEAAWRDLCGPRGPRILIGLTSIHWREAWKYGERAWRYCQLDMGHAIASVDYAAAMGGWRSLQLSHMPDPRLARMLGIHRQEGPEAEVPGCLIALWPRGGLLPPEWVPGQAGCDALLHNLRPDAPARLSAKHHEWEVIDNVEAACRMPEPPGADYLAPLPAGVPVDELRPLAARRLVRQRRSATGFDPEATLERDAFYRMLERTLPRSGKRPWLALPWQPAAHLLLFVHRVEGLEPGLYLLLREDSAFDELRRSLKRDFRWSSPPECPPELPLYLLQRGDAREAAQAICCHQQLAGEASFTVGMFASFEERLVRFGPWAYRPLHWEAGAIGQALYLEAEAEGMRGTGIGCFFDEPMLNLLGLKGWNYQSLYAFAVGKPVADSRLQTLPAYS